MKIKNRATNQGGFTLMEMMLVLGIIALLLGVGTYAMVGVMSGADQGRVKADIRAIETNLIRYKSYSQTFPTTEQGLLALVSKPEKAPQPKNWEQTSKKEGIMDPWGRQYEYVYPGKRNPKSYDIFSVGPDGKANTEDDIGNWETKS